MSAVDRGWRTIAQSLNGSRRIRETFVHGEAGPGMAGETERSRRKPPAVRGVAAEGGAGGARATSGARVTKTKAPLITAAGDPVQRLEELVAAITAERDRLKSDLATTEARVKTLEAQNRAALDRIDWIIDSLETALGE